MLESASSHLCCLAKPFTENFIWVKEDARPETLTCVCGVTRHLSIRCMSLSLSMDGTGPQKPDEEIRPTVQLPVARPQPHDTSDYCETYP